MNSIILKLLYAFVDFNGRSLGNADQMACSLKGYYSLTFNVAGSISKFNAYRLFAYISSASREDISKASEYVAKVIDRNESQIKGFELFNTFKHKMSISFDPYDLSNCIHMGSNDNCSLGCLVIVDINRTREFEKLVSDIGDSRYKVTFEI